MISLEYQTEWNVKLNDIPNTTTGHIIIFSPLFDEYFYPFLIRYVEIHTEVSQ